MRRRAIGCLAAFSLASLVLPTAASELRPAATFATIEDPRLRAEALFREAGKVLLHPRCVNCHVSGDRPLQTERSAAHEPPVLRGAEGRGTPAMACATCHRAANYDPARVPGHPEWRLSPPTTGWHRRTLGEICLQLKDPARNGGKDPAALLHHFTQDTLAGWSWAPGIGRAPAPGTQAEFAELMRAWVAAGAHCPTP
jgi:hypothetical protein